MKFRYSFLTVLLYSAIVCNSVHAVKWSSHMPIQSSKQKQTPPNNRVDLEGIAGNVFSAGVAVWICISILAVLGANVERFQKARNR